MDEESSREAGPRPGSLAHKIEFLRQRVHPAGGRPPGDQEIAAAISELTGETVSRNTIWRLRTGQTDNPTKRVLEGLAAFFKVDPAYFFDADGSEFERQIEQLALLRGAGARGAGLRSFFTLSPEAQDMIARLIEDAARIERRRGHSSGK